MKMQSERLFLSPDIDAQVARNSRNHPDIWKWCRQYSLISWNAMEKWTEMIEADQTIKMFGIRSKKQSNPMVGVCGFTSIDRHNRSAEFSLYINPCDQGKGYGKEALTLLINHGFNDWGFHRIWGESYEKNPAIKTFKDLGFKIMGTLRESYYRDGKFINSHMIDLLQKEWNERKS